MGNTEIIYHINIVLCPIKVNSNKIKVTVHSSCYYILDLLCFIDFIAQLSINNKFGGQKGLKQLKRLLKDIQNVDPISNKVLQKFESEKKIHKNLKQMQNLISKRKQRTASHRGLDGRLTNAVAGFIQESGDMYMCRNKSQKVLDKLNK